MKSESGFSLQWLHVTDNFIKNTKTFIKSWKSHRVLQTGVPLRSMQFQWTFPPKWNGNWQILPDLINVIWTSCKQDTFSSDLLMASIWSADLLMTSIWTSCKQDTFSADLVMTSFYLVEHFRGTEALRLPTSEWNATPDQKACTVSLSHTLHFHCYDQKPPVGHYHRDQRVLNLIQYHYTVTTHLEVNHIGGKCGGKNVTMSEWEPLGHHPPV